MCNRLPRCAFGLIAALAAAGCAEVSPGYPYYGSYPLAYGYAPNYPYPGGAYPYSYGYGGGFIAGGGGYYHRYYGPENGERGGQEWQHHGGEGWHGGGGGHGGGPAPVATAPAPRPAPMAGGVRPPGGAVGGSCAALRCP
jgi:hypothetical protein